MAIVALAPKLPEQDVPRAYDAALQLPRAWDRAEVLTALIPRMSSPEREQATQMAFDSILAIRAVPHYHANAFRALAPYMTSDMSEQAINFMRSRDNSYSADALSRAMPGLAGSMRGAATTEAMAILSAETRPYSKVAGLAALIPQLEGGDRKAALEMAISTVLDMSADELDTEKAAIALVPLVDGGDRDRVVAVGLARARQIFNPVMRTDALAKLVSYLEGAEKAKVLEDAIEWTARIEDGQKCAEVLDELLTETDADLRARMLDVVTRVESSQTRAEVVSSFVPHSDDAERTTQIRAIRESILDSLSEAADGPRRTLLEWIDHSAVFAPPVFPRERLETLVRDIAEIRSDWKWR
jgi:hypothetical protein